jgi:hypothetical protein
MTAIEHDHGHEMLTQIGNAVQVEVRTSIQQVQEMKGRTCSSKKKLILVFWRNWCSSVTLSLMEVKCSESLPGNRLF